MHFAALPRVEPAGFSCNGFHASAEGYAYVAGHLANTSWETG